MSALNQIFAVKIVRTIKGHMYVLVILALNSTGPLCVSISTNVIQVPVVRMLFVMILREASLVNAKMDTLAMVLFAKVHWFMEFKSLVFENFTS